MRDLVDRQIDADPHCRLQVGTVRYPNAREIFITADAGGSNGYRSHVWKYELQRFADKHHIAGRVSHFPPGTSKWNKVEHRLFSWLAESRVDRFVDQSQKIGDRQDRADLIYVRWWTPSSSFARSGAC